MTGLGVRSDLVLGLKADTEPTERGRAQRGTGGRKRDWRLQDLRLEIGCVTAGGGPTTQLLGRLLELQGLLVR